MDIRLLGPVELWHAGQPFQLGPQQQRCLLAALAVPPGRPVSAEKLAERVWGHQLAGSARSSLYTNLSRLRKVVARTDGALQRDDSGYLLVAAKDDVDLYRARRLFAEAQQLARELPDGPQQAVEVLRDADALWRGTPLADLRGDWADRLRQALCQERLATAVQRYEWELRFNEPAAVAHALAELHAESPLAEPVTALLMRALWQSGRQTVALQVFAAARQRVIDELGVEPGAELRNLHQQLLRDEVPFPEPPPRQPSAQRPGAPQGSMPVSSAGAPDHGSAPRQANCQLRPAQLPPGTRAFTGRGRELAQLQRFTAGDGAPVVVVSGVAGVGKTALVVHWGHGVRDRFPDGQLYVNLRGYSHCEPVLPAQVLARFLPALGLPEERVPTGAEEAEALYHSMLADRAVLVVLDNATRPDQVRPLLPGGRSSMALVTSRDRLDGLVARDGAQSLRLGPLAADEARQLLVHVVGPQPIAAEHELVDELVELCGRLPLALRIAAARISAHPRRSIADYVRRLRGDDNLAELTVPGDPDGAVSAAFDLSYARLPSAAQHMFRLLGLVPGPDITAVAAAALAGVGQAPAERLLEGLAAAHLVEESGPGRYALLDPLRRYASNRAVKEEPPAGRQAARSRLFDHYLRRTDAAARLLYPHMLRLPPPADLERPDVYRFDDHARALAWLDDEAAALVAAVRSASAEGPRPVAWLLGDALRGYFRACRLIVDGLTVGQAAVTAAEADGDMWALAFSQFSLADVHAYRHEHRTAIWHYQQALSTSGTIGSGDQRMQAWSAEFRMSVLHNIGVVTAECGLPRRAARYFSRSLALSRKDDLRVAMYFCNLGDMSQQLGRPAQAVRHHVAALALFRKLNNPAGEGTALCGLARAHQALGEFDRAMGCLADALPLTRLARDRLQEFTATCLLAAVLRDTGQPVDDALDSALWLARDIGDDALSATATHLLGTISHTRGHYREALAHQRHAVKLARQARAPYQYAEALIGMAAAKRALGDHSGAHHCIERALPVVRKSEYRLLEAAASTVFADLDSAATVCLPETPSGQLRRHACTREELRRGGHVGGYSVGRAGPGR